MRRGSRRSSKRSPRSRRRPTSSAERLTVNPITGLITLSTLLNVGNEITWQSGGVSDIGQVIEELIAGSPNTWRMRIESYADFGDVSQVLLEAVETGGSTQASLSVVQETSGGGTSAAVDAGAGNNTLECSTKTATPISCASFPAGPLRSTRERRS